MFIPIGKAESQFLLILLRLYMKQNFELYAMMHLL